jgi:hypothetical protein
VAFNRFSFLSNFPFISIPTINRLSAACNAEVTGRTTQIEVNADGTKTMLTGGTKTIYSWDTDKGEITQKTETVKSHCKLRRLFCSSQVLNFNISNKILQNSVYPI